VSDERAVRILVHRQNINRYKTLLRTKLTVLERDFIARRIAEEQAEIDRNAHVIGGERLSA
jgi:hypothetical protein